MSAHISSAPHLFQMRSHGYELTPDRVGQLRATRDIRDVAALRDRMNVDGYLYLPQLLRQDEVMAARLSICVQLSEQGNLDCNAPLVDAVAHPHKTLAAFSPDLAGKNPAVQRLLYAGPMMEFFASFLGGAVRHFDYTWLRTVEPGKGTPSHCDVVYMGRGTHNLFTAWTPLGDTSYWLGGLMILEGSNNHERLRHTYCMSDVDSFCENRPDRRDAWDKRRGGSLSNNPLRIQDSLGGRWLTTEFSAGDVLVFTVFTVHASLDNQSDRIRMSLDTRYQLASDPADERWIGENPIGHGKAGKRGRIC